MQRTSPTKAFVARYQGSIKQFVCDHGQIILVIEVFSSRSTAARLAAEQRRLIGDIAWEDVETSPIPNSSGSWRLWKVLTSPQVVATSIWLGGKPIQLDLTARIRMAWCSIFGGWSKPVLMVLRVNTNPLSAETPDGDQAAARLVGFVRMHPALSALASQFADVND
jgi:hypothetical protein